MNDKVMEVTYNINCLNKGKMLFKKPFPLHLYRKIFNSCIKKRSAVKQTCNILKENNLNWKITKHNKSRFCAQGVTEWFPEFKNDVDMTFTSTRSQPNWTHGRFWTDVTLHHNHQNTQWGDIFWENCVHVLDIFMLFWGLTVTLRCFFL